MKKLLSCSPLFSLSGYVVQEHLKVLFPFAYLCASMHGYDTSFCKSANTRDHRWQVMIGTVIGIYKPSMVTVLPLAIAISICGTNSYTLPFCWGFIGHPAGDLVGDRPFHCGLRIPNAVNGTNADI